MRASRTAEIPKETIRTKGVEISHLRRPGSPGLAPMKLSSGVKTNIWMRYTVNECLAMHLTTEDSPKRFPMDRSRLYIATAIITKVGEVE